MRLILMNKMKSVYCDTNIFIYYAEPKSAYYKKCLDFLTYCQEESISIVTSSETIQEIIHYSQRTNQLPEGINVCNIVMNMVDDLFPINAETIKEYLYMIRSYPKTPSRDILHVASCRQYQIKYMITFDKDFKSIKEIQAVRPDNFINSNTV